MNREISWLNELWDNILQSVIDVIRLPEREEERKKNNNSKNNE